MQPVLPPHMCRECCCWIFLVIIVHRTLVFYWKSGVSDGSRIRCRNSLPLSFFNFKWSNNYITYYNYTYHNIIVYNKFYYFYFMEFRDHSNTWWCILNFQDLSWDASLLLKITIPCIYIVLSKVVGKQCLHWSSHHPWEVRVKHKYCWPLSHILQILSRKTTCWSLNRNYVVLKRLYENMYI